MTDLIQHVAEYLTEKLNMDTGTQVMCYEMPEKSDTCVCIYEVLPAPVSPPQIDAISRRIRIVVRAKSNGEANELSERCWQWMLCSATNDFPTGFIELKNNVFVFSDLQNKPIWQKSDQKNRKYFSFDTVITTTK